MTSNIDTGSLAQRLDIIEKFLSGKAGADVNTVDVNGNAFKLNPCDVIIVDNCGQTNQHFDNGNSKNTIIKLETKKKCLDALLSLTGADVNGTVTDQKTLLVLAAQYGYTRCSQLLLQAGASLENKDLFGYTALFHACREGRGECVKVLLQAGADVNTSDTKGSTALIEAAYCGQTQCIRLLLTAGARVNIKNDSDHNALLAHISRHCSRDTTMLLYAAGEIIGGSTIQVEQWTHDTVYMEVPSYLQRPHCGVSLKQACRDTIRDRLIRVDPHTHLFERIPHLGLPSQLVNYLLYHCSLQ